MSTLQRYMNAVGKLSQEDQAYIAGLIKKVEIPAGETWSAESKQCIGCIEQGLLAKITRIKYQMRILGIYKDGEGFPLGTLEVNFRFKAIETTVIHYIVHEDFRAICARYPRLTGIVIKFMQKDMRHLSFSSRLTEEPDPMLRYQLYVKRFPTYAARIPVKVLAEYLTMSEKMIEAAGKNRGLKVI